jgi:hypothetical protein
MDFCSNLILDLTQKQSKNVSQKLKMEKKPIKKNLKNQGKNYRIP